MAGLLSGRLTRLMPSSRNLFSAAFSNKADTPQDHVLVAGGSAQASAAAALKAAGDERHSSVLSALPWQARVSDDFAGAPYGQTADGASPLTEIFVKESSRLPKDALMTWFQVGAAKKAALQSLSMAPGFDVFNESASALHALPGGGVSMQTVTGNSVKLTRSQTTIRNRAVEPRLPSLLTQWGARSSVDHVWLYTRTHAEIAARFKGKKLLVIGAGLSLAWMAEQFPYLDITALGLPGDKIPTSAPRVAHIDTSNVKLYESGTYHVYPNADGYTLVTDEGGFYQMVSHHDVIFSAAGFVPCDYLTNSMPSHMLEAVKEHAAKPWVHPGTPTGSEIFKHYEECYRQGPVEGRRTYSLFAPVMPDENQMIDWMKAHREKLCFVDASHISDEVIGHVDAAYKGKILSFDTEKSRETYRGFFRDALKGNGICEDSLAYVEAQLFEPDRKIRLRMEAVIFPASCGVVSHSEPSQSAPA